MAQEVVRVVRMRIAAVTVASKVVATRAQHFARAYTRAAKQDYSVDASQASAIEASLYLAQAFVTEASATVAAGS